MQDEVVLRLRPKGLFSRKCRSGVDICLPEEWGEINFETQELVVETFTAEPGSNSENLVEIIWDEIEQEAIIQGNQINTTDENEMEMYQGDFSDVIPEEFSEQLSEDPGGAFL